MRKWSLAMALVVSVAARGADDVPSPVPPAATTPSATPAFHPPPANRLNAAEELSTLTQVASLHQLSREEAKRRHPVHFTGVVTYHDAMAWQTTFIQDSTGGVYLESGGKSLPVEFADEALRSAGLRYGQQVEVTGFSDPGGFAPFVVQPRLRVLGPGTLPTPKVIPFDELAAGQQDGMWVELEGIVHAVRDPSVALAEGKEHVNIEVVGKGRRFRVWIPNWDHPLPVGWTDAKVRLRGVCGATTTKQMQMLGLELLVPGPSEVEVLEPAPADPFALPVRPINSLLKYSLELTNEHRIRVQGVVLHHRPGRDLFVRDDTQSLHVLTLQTNQLQPGDRVDVVGFAESGRSGPVLEGANYRRLGPGPAVVPRGLAPNELLQRGREAELVQLDGHLISRGREAGKDVLLLGAGDLIFSAELDDASVVYHK